MKSHQELMEEKNREKAKMAMRSSPAENGLKAVFENVPLFQNIASFEGSFNTLSMVCKRWNKEVQLIVAGYVSKIQKFIQMPNEKVSDLRCVDDVMFVFESLKVPSCYLYRRPIIETKTADLNLCWPELLPEYRYQLHLFVYKLCTLKSTTCNKADEVLYNRLSSCIDAHSEKHVKEIKEYFRLAASNASITPIHILKKCVDSWKAWQGYILTLIRCAMYIDAYYTDVNSLPKLNDLAKDSLKRHLSTLLDDENKNIMYFLRQCFQKVMSCDTFNQEEQEIIFDAFVINIISSNPRQSGGVIRRYLLEDRSIPAMTVIEDAVEKNWSKRLTLNNIVSNSENQTIQLICMATKKSIQIPVDAPLLKQSLVLKDMNFRHGDRITLDVDSRILQGTMTFCEMDQEDPMIEIDKPLRSADMVQVVGERYGNFVNRFTQETLFEFILFSNQLRLLKLLDLCTAKVASLIKGRTPEQIRQTFNITNDFTPEEEAQVREENRWSEPV